MINNNKLPNQDIDIDLLEKINSFLNHIDNTGYSGYSVYDSFNSPILKPISKLNIKIVNVIITQFFKQIPLNINSEIIVCDNEDNIFYENFIFLNIVKII